MKLIGSTSEKVEVEESCYAKGNMLFDYARSLQRLRRTDE